MAQGVHEYKKKKVFLPFSRLEATEPVYVSLDQRSDWVCSGWRENSYFNRSFIFEMVEAETDIIPLYVNWSPEKGRGFELTLEG